VKFALTKTEYRSALHADHGTVRRFLAGCRCTLCDRPAYRRFSNRDRAKRRR
jgi:hypothetical protein